MTEAQLLTLITFGLSALGTVIWYVIRRGDSRQDAERRERTENSKADREMFLNLYNNERASRDAERVRIEAALQQARHDMRDEVTSVAAKQAAHELYCAREYVSYPRLTEALRPLAEGMDKIFERLDTKADK